VVIDPIEQTLRELDYFRARIQAIRRLARSTDHPHADPYAAIESIATECDYLMENLARIQEALDPESRP
jgi:hypothetical protein